MSLKTTTKEKSRVLLIGSIPPPYHGSNIYFQKLLNSKINEEYILFHLDTSDHRNMDNLGILDFTNAKIALKNLMLLVLTIFINRPEIIYLCPASTFWPFLRDSLFIIIANCLSNAEIVIHMHGGTYFRNVFYQKSNIVIKYYIKWTLRKVKIAIVVGQNLKTIFDGLVKRIYVVWNGTEIYEVDKIIKKNKNDNVIISYLGNLFRSKGIIDILNAVEIIVKKHSNVIFRFAGAWSGQELNTQILARRIIEERNIRKYVEISGLVLGKAKQKYLSETDIFVLPTWYEYESFPAVIIEAMVAYCPVISTKDIGAIQEIVIDGETGILVEKQNIQQIAEAISRLIEDVKIRVAMGKAGRERVEKIFSWDMHIMRIIEIFNVALKHKNMRVHRSMNNS